MRVEPVKVVIEWLRQQPELTGVKVQSKKTGTTTSDRIVLVRSIGGYRMVRDVLDRWELVIEYFAPTEAAVKKLAMDASSFLLERLVATRYGGAYINDCLEIVAPFDLAEDTNSVPGQERMVSQYAIFMRKE